MRANLCAGGIVAATLLVFACEEPRARAPTVPDEPVARPLCEARCDHAARCGEDTSCSCAQSHETLALRADWARADIACLRDPKCTGEDECEAIASRAIGLAPLAWPPVVLRCLQKGDVCGGSGATCRRLAATTSDVQHEADVCFAKGCDAYASCFGALWNARVVASVPAWRN